MFYCIFYVNMSVEKQILVIPYNINNIHNYVYTLLCNHFIYEKVLPKYSWICQ